MKQSFLFVCIRLFIQTSTYAWIQTCISFTSYVHRRMCITGDYFEYYSGIQLKGNEGEMHGTFQMVTVEDNNKFEAEVAPFKVNAPR